MGLTTAVDGAAALIEIAVAAAGTDVPAIAGMRFLAVVEVHSSAVDIEGELLIIRTSDGQRSAVLLDSIVVPRRDGGLMDDMSVLEPLEHSVLGLSLKGGDVCRDKVVRLHPLEHSGVDRSADMMGGASILELLEYSVPKVPLDERDQFIGSRTVLNPLEYAGASIVGKLLSASGPLMYSEGARDGRGGLRVHGGADGTLQDFRREANRVPPEEGEAIVVGPLARRHRGS